MQQTSAMKLKLLIYLLVSGIGLLAGYGKPPSILINGNPAHPYRILACYKETVVSNQTVINTLSAIDLAEKEKLKLIPGLVVLEDIAQQKSITAGVYEESSLSSNLIYKIETLKKTGLFKYVEPDWITTRQTTPTDAAFVDGRLWGLRNTGQGGGVAGADINAVNAWNISTGSPSVIVAIIDSGVRYTHVDLSANMWRNPDEIPGNNKDDDGNGYIDDVYGVNTITGSGDPMDDDGHGTHIAGTIGAVANNGQPHVGIAWNVRIMACKFLDSSGNGKISDEIKGIDYAISKGARIINMSFGDYVFSQAEYDALSKARQNNVLIVAAAGNEGVNNDTSPLYPASYNLDNIISVASFNRYNQLSSFSNYGQNSVHIAAPGEAIFSCWNGSDTDYKTVSGTSMAVPHISGVAALVLSYFPQISTTQLRSQILQSAVAVPSLQGKTITGGRVDAYRAFGALPDGIMEFSISPQNGTSQPAGSSFLLTIQISDLFAVTNATLTGSTSAGSPLSFTNISSSTDGRYYTVVPVPQFISSLSVSISVSAPGKISTNISLTYPVVTPAGNDDFYKSQNLGNATNITVRSSNALATKQQGEPDHAGNAGGKSLWYIWTPSVSELATISTDGSDFDTLLAVYTGTVISNLNSVAQNDDNNRNTSAGTSRVYFYAAAGVSYRIAVDGYGGAYGNLVLTINLDPSFTPPSNDNFANRITLSGQNVTINGTNTGATFESGEPFHAGKTGGASVWYSWTSPFTGYVSIDTAGSDFDTILAVYTGSTLNSLSPVASNDDATERDLTSKVIFDVVAGTTYQIAIDGYGGDCGTFFLSINKLQGGSAPPNDLFQNAILISGSSTIVTGSNIGATKETGEPDHSGNSGGSSVWWRWVAPSNTTVVISTEDSDFDTLLAVYTGSTLQNLTVVAQNDDDYYGSGYSVVTFSATSNQIYYIAVDGYASSGGQPAQGTIKLTIRPVSPPVNDNFQNRILLSGVIVSTEGNNYGATAEPDEPYHSGYQPNRSVWWSWTAPYSGFVSVSTFGSSFDTLLGIYTGNVVTNLTRVAGSDDAYDIVGPSMAFFRADAGVTYHIAIDGYNGSSGNIKLRIAQNYSATNLYFTGFTPAEGYSTSTQLAGVNGWQCTFNGGNGIMANRFPFKDQQAYIGLSPTTGAQNSTVLLWRPLNYIPKTNDLIMFSALMEINDSTTGYYDSFGWSFYNRNSERLFSLDFDNYTMKVSYILDDGQGLRFADMYFENGSIYTITVLLNPSSNRWSAWLNGVPIAENQQITTKGSTIDIGDIDASWIWGDTIAGNNFMLFDDYRMEIVNELNPPAIIEQPQSVVASEGTNITLRVVASGAQPLYYRWLFNGNPISSATNPVYQISNATTNRSGIYTVVVSNLFGAIVSDPATVIINKIIPPPANDNFANRMPLAGITNLVTGSNASATREINEPFHSGNTGGRSVWFSFTPPYTGRFTISTIGSDFDTILAVYTGSALNSLSLVASNDDAQNNVRASWLTFYAVAGTTYQIALDGFNGASGNYRLMIKPDASPSFSSAIYRPQEGFSFAISAESGLTILIQSSTNLINWTTVTNFYNGSGSLFFTDPDVNNNKMKFYRALHTQ